ncbi:MAG: MerR family transcriptional regulator [Candidatus Bruticola sp.]
MRTYTIGQVSEEFALPISTLRFYDKEGLFPNLRRKSGIRRFTDREIDTLRIIECLKKSGLGIKDIKMFIEWCNQGSDTFGLRLELFRRQKACVEAEIARMNQVLNVIKFKCWYYEYAMEHGRLVDIEHDEIPEEMRRLYEITHKRPQTEEVPLRKVQ